MTAVSPRLVPDVALPTFADGSPVVSSDAGQAHPVRTLSLVDVDQGLSKIASLMRGNTRIPTQRAAELASEWLCSIYERATKLGGWRLPHISSTEAGEIVFEWWRGPRNLTLYFADGGAEYIEVWGPDMDDEMRSGLLSNWSFSNAWLSLQS
jgi:hypothetical protein